MGYYNDKIISELRVRQLQLEAIYNKSCKYQHLSVEERYNSNMYNRLYNIYTYSKSKLNTFKSWIALHQSIEGQNYYNTLEDYERVSLLARLTIVCLELSFEYCHSFATYRLADENKYLSDLRYNWIDFSDDFEEKRNQIKNTSYDSSKPTITIEILGLGISESISGKQKTNESNNNIFLAIKAFFRIFYR